MSELATHPILGLALLLVVASSTLAAFYDALGRHSTLSRILLLLASLSCILLLALGWKRGMQPFRYPLAALACVSASAAFFAVFWSSTMRGPRLLAAILLVAGSLSFGLAPGLAWPWKQAQSSWFLGSELLYTLSAGALWASAVRANMSETASGAPAAGTEDRVSLHTVAVALVAQTLALILLGVGAQVTWGGYWRWDPIESWRLAAWLATTALAIVLGQLGWRRRRARLATSLVAAFVLFVLWGAFPLVHWLGLLSAYLPS